MSKLAHQRHNDADEESKVKLETERPIALLISY